MAIAVKKSEKFYFLLFLQMSFKNKRNFFDRALQHNSNYLFKFQKEFWLLAIFLKSMGANTHDLKTDGCLGIHSMWFKIQSKGVSILFHTQIGLPTEFDTKNAHHVKMDSNKKSVSGEKTVQTS